jgi:hypothetical protein
MDVRGLTKPDLVKNPVDELLVLRPAAKEVAGRGPLEVVAFKNTAKGL